MSVRSALARLDADEREMLMLREYDQLSYQEIADLKAVLDAPVHVPVQVTPVKVTHDGH